MPKNSKLVLEKSLKKSNEEKLNYIKNARILYIPISIGQDYHEREKLLEFFMLIKKNFESLVLVKIIIVDTPQRYHLAVRNKGTPKSMYRKSKKNGNIWEENYKYLIENTLSFKVEFSKWNKWLNHESFKEARKEIEHLYNSNIIFKSNVERDILEFERRYSNRENHYFTEEEKEYCRKCIKEECAVLIVWGKDRVYTDCPSLIYPKLLTNSLSLVKNNYTNFISLSTVLKVKSASSSCFHSLTEKIPLVDNDLPRKICFTN
jgi:hypothetical protein